MRVLFASSEIAPFAKTGGLADVSGSLPIELSRLGHQVTLITPAFRQCFQSGHELHETDVVFDIPIGGKIVHGQLLRATFPDTDVDVYFVDQRDYFDRVDLYQEDGEDFRDNCERFVFFCRAALESARLLDLQLDVIHCNDWQTGLIPAYLRLEYATSERFRQVASLLTIHNLLYQGSFWHWDMLLTGLDWKYFNWHQMECYGRLNLLKTGIVFADAINTVSPRYAEEIQGNELGCGLEGVLQQRRDVLSGIINGVDYTDWNPATDRHIAQTYDIDTWQAGKRACKSALQQELGLPANPGVPLIGLVGRLAEQKGWDLIIAVMRQWAASSDAQWAILGAGERDFQRALTKLAEQFPDKIAARLQFSDAMAHRIEAGADMFLMPSHYEPCGLNQMYSLKYGTVPVVRDTGGLANTVVDAAGPSMEDGTATGFKFKSYDAESLDAVLRRACEVFRDRPAEWSGIVNAGMKQDWSWSRSAREYQGLYESILARRRSAVGHV